MIADLTALRRLHGDGRLDAAEQAGEALLASGGPLDAGARAQILTILADCALRRGAVGSALARLRAAVELLPGSGVLHFNLGLALRRVDDGAGAEAAFAAAVAADPRLGPAWFERAGLALFRNDYGTAGPAFLQAARCGVRPREAEELAAWCRRFGPDSPGPTPAERDLRVSVVIPCFNYGAYVAEAVESVRAQSLGGVEIVVVEGGSTDGTTPAVVDALEGPGVRIVRRDRPQPPGANRNAGVAATTGDLVCCLDADDRLAPDYLEKAVWCVAVLGYDIVGAAAKEFGSGSRRRSFAVHPGLDRFLLQNELAMPALFRRTVWERAGGFRDVEGADGHVHEDWLFWQRAVALGFRVFNIAWEYLLEIRGHDMPGRVSSRRNILPVERQRDILRSLNADVLGNAAVRP